MAGAMQVATEAPLQALVFEPDSATDPVAGRSR